MRKVFAICALTVLLPVAALAQGDCLLGVYGDAAGTQEHAELEWVSGGELGGDPTVLYQLDVYYVLMVEDFVRGVAWKRTVDGYSHSDVYPSYSEARLVGSIQHYDPLQQFLEVTEDGFRMGLGDCHVGYGGTPIMVLQETLFLEFDHLVDRVSVFVRLEPNILEDDQYAVYADCSQEATKKPCMLQDHRTIGGLESGKSWGALKAKYR